MRDRLFALVMIVLVAGCNASAPTPVAPEAPQAQAAAQAPAGNTGENGMKDGDAATAASATPDLGSAIKPGMAYADFRKAILDQGWSPVRDAQCLANVVGDNHEQLCSQHPELALCKACNDMPELSSCSTDGYCVMRFGHGGDARTLRVVSYGMTDDWNVPGEDSRLEISSWTFDGDAAKE